MNAEEEQRAADYRAQQATQVAAVRARVAALTGDPDAAAEVAAAFKPLRDAARERRAGPPPIRRARKRITN